jgi:phosphinothricin acetyltransferase
MTVRAATERDAEAIAVIYNCGIAERQATFETAPRTADALLPALRDQSRFPFLVASEDGRVAGWASLSLYRPRQCYSGIAEFSIYLDPAYRGRGIGRVLLEALIDDARRRGFWKILSRVFVSNAASRALCRATGFREVGVYQKHGQLDGRWIDVVIVERLIPENMEEMEERVRT